MPNSPIGYIVTLLLALVGSGGFWGLLQARLNRQGRKAEAAKAVADEETTRKRSEDLLAEARALAQTTALSSAHDAYQTMRTQYEQCEIRLSKTEERLAKAEERERSNSTALQAIIRALDANDPAGIAEAVTAARVLT